ncbi:CotH kinase family protein [Streptomyces albus]|uniref:CotH kinase family protein n=1 Tax=Streptomyces albus TaxID=1888 RepID=UPI000A45C4CC|nr:CotH kinase family protein [Streptomyces albus]
MRRKRMGTVGLLAAVSLVMTGLAGPAGASGDPAPPDRSWAQEARAAEKTGPAKASDTGAAAPTKATKADIAAGEQSAEDLTGDITFSTPGGTFQNEVSVSLGTTIADAQIRYTTDGQLPTASSTLYSGPLRLTSTTQLRAQAFVNGTASGDPGTAVYVARSVNANHDLPLLVLDAYGAGKPDREYRDVAALLMEPQGGTTSLGAAPAVATRAGFHLRGQSSASFEKAPYRIEFRDNADKDADYPVLGMPADSDWVLRSPFPDKTLVRDAFAYTLGREMGLQTPRHRFVEVYLNLDGGPLGADDYQGVYVLDENIKVSPDRLDIAKLKKGDLTEPAVTGGYVMKFDAWAAEEPKLPCTGQECWSDLEVTEPNDLQPEQKTWITQYVQKLHNALRSANPSDPQTGYPAYIDVDSFVNLIILNEMGRQGDSYLRSMYMYKDRGGKLTAGPLWDYDLGFNAIPNGSPVDGWQFQPFFGFGTTDWFLKLMQDPSFNQKVQARWQELRSGVLSDAQLRNRVTQLTSPLANGAQRNFQKWPNLNTRQVGPFQTQTTQTWQEQLTLMQNWLVQRAAWIDSSGWEVGETGTPPWPPAAGAQKAPLLPHLRAAAERREGSSG